MPKILIITTSFPLTTDGSEAAGTFVKDFASVLNQQCPTAVCYPANGLISNDIDDNILHYPFSVPALPLSLLNPVHPANWLSIAKTLSSGWYSVERAVLEFKPDHVLALWALPSGFWAKRVKERYGIPYSTWSLGSDIWMLGRYPVIKSLLRTVLRNASCRFADGRLLLDDVALIADKKVEFLPSSRTLSVPNNRGIKEAPPYNLAFLGRWHTNKGIDLLLETLCLLQGKDWEKINNFSIAGGGPLESLVKKQVGKLRQAGRPVRLSGFMNTFEATELLLWADYLVIPSRIESIPVVYSDALQCTTPMVVTPVGDFPALFQNNAPGLMAKNVTVIDLLDVIKVAIETSPSEFTNNIYYNKDIFSMENVIDNYLSHIRQIP